MKKATGIVGKCDVLFSKIVRYEGKCQRCGSTNTLQCSHFYSRRYSWTRTYELNAVCLCAGCHHFVGANPLEHVEFFRGLRGEAALKDVRERRNRLDKFPWDDELMRLQIRAKELGI